MARKRSSRVSAPQIAAAVSLAKTLPPIKELGAGQPDTTIRGFLRAWNPVTQTLAWEQETSGPWAGTMNAFWNVMSPLKKNMFRPF